ncbi:MAG: hypothetical protein ABSE63_12380 [Thermoguttaceae bacterium]|jgi:hypothetical protein
MKRFLTMCCLCALTLPWTGVIWGQDAAAKDRKKSITVYPVVLNSGAPVPGLPADMPNRIAEVIGVVLERDGMKDTELADAAFVPPEKTDLAKSAEAFAQYVKERNLNTEYALYGQFFGTPGKGIDEIRIVVADRQGKVILSEQRNKEQLQQPGEERIDPMSASCGLVERVRGLWGLADVNEGDVPEGKLEKRLKEKSGMPPASEFEEMKKRLDVLKEKVKTGKIAVYPIHIWLDKSDQSGAVQLAKMINESGVCQAITTDADPNLKIKGNINEQIILWDTARAFRDFLRKNPPPADYALLASYVAVSPDGKREAGAVHLILCDKAGDWVLVDFQNDHHADFQSIAPKTADDCNRLAVVRLKSHLSK